MSIFKNEDDLFVKILDNVQKNQERYLNYFQETAKNPTWIFSYPKEKPSGSTKSYYSFPLVNYYKHKDFPDSIEFMEIALPGYKKEDLEVNVAVGSTGVKELTVKSNAKSHPERNYERTRHFQTEKFVFSTRLNKDAELLDASHENGVLTLKIQTQTLPKREVKTIPIN